jgi:outer membrane protein OmpA-like peptidoglycan-associated protein
MNYLGACSMALICAACGASTPSKELLTARNAYSEARNGEAAQLNPTGVHDAYKALQQAEAVHADDPGSKKERNYAYIAARKSELAIAKASEELARNEQQRADETYKATLEQKSEQLAQRSERVAEQSSEYAQQLNQTQQQLQDRDQKLEEVQQAAQRAEQELRQMEAMREEAGRLIISMSGVLFETGSSDLSDLARNRLDTVARALAAYPDREIVVEGHTDAQGNDETNRELSQKRADAVRQYLESKGVPADRIRSVGQGESNPVASNDNPEGRAINRRVEIVVDRAPARQNAAGSDSADSPATPVRPSPQSAPQQ